MDNKKLEWSDGEKTSIENIRKVEQKLGVSFPKEYIEIVLEYDGGLCFPNSFVTKNGVGEILGQLESIDRILTIIELMKKENRHVKNTVPIYVDGNYAVCLDYRESKTEPKVFFNDCTRSYYDEEFNILTFIDPIADSFKEFLECLFRPDYLDELDRRFDM